MLNYKLEPLLPLVELWRDGCALSASGYTPRVSLNGLNTSAPPPQWSCGQAILQFRTLIFPWTKYHLLLSLIEQTSTTSSGPASIPPTIRLALSHGNLNHSSLPYFLAGPMTAELHCQTQVTLYFLSWVYLLTPSKLC